jgi:hypothetical protein
MCATIERSAGEAELSTAVHLLRDEATPNSGTRRALPFRRPRALTTELLAHDAEVSIVFSEFGTDFQAFRILVVISNVDLL